MQNNKVILGYCPNFDKIVNTDFLEHDNVSLALVKIYRDFIFRIDIKNEMDIEKVKVLDKTMGKYVDDYFFRKIMQEQIIQTKVKKEGNVLRTLVDLIISIFRRYEEDSTRKIYISKWI